MILLGMVFLPKLKIHRVTAKTNKQNKTKLQHPEYTELAYVAWSFQNAKWDFTMLHQESFMTVIETGPAFYSMPYWCLSEHQSDTFASDVSWSTHRFHTRTHPFSFPLLATDQMRTHTASVCSWFCASCRHESHVHLGISEENDEGV